MSKKFLIFDFDGTLVDSMRHWERILPETLAEYNITDISKINDEMRRLSLLEFSKFLEERYPVLSEGKPLRQKWADKMEHYYTHDVKLRTNAKEFLDYLKQQNKYKFCLASATDKPLLTVALKHFGLYDYFDIILTEKEVGKTKKNPDLYNECMKRAGVTPDETVIFEDVVYAIRTARSINTTICAVFDEAMKRFEDEIKTLADVCVDDFATYEKILPYLE